MKSWNITMITGLVGVLYFVLISLVFGPMNLVIGNQIAFIAVSILAIIAAVVNGREADNSTWRTWVGLIGALLIALPGVSSLVASLLLLGGDSLVDLASSLATLAAIGMLILLPVGIVMCLVAGFSRYHENRRFVA